MVKTLSISVPGQGLYEFTSQAQKVVQESAQEDGLCTLFIQHASASLLIQENADPSARVY